MKSYKRAYQIPFYNCSLTVVIGDSDKLSEIAGMVNFEDSHINEFNACVVEGDPGSIAVLLVDDIPFSDIAHESVHIMNRVFKHIRAHYDLDHDEPQAYLMGWIVETIMKHKQKFDKMK